MIGILDFGIKKVPIDYIEEPKLQKDIEGRYYINYFKFYVEQKYLFFFKLWMNNYNYSCNSKKLDIKMNGTLILVGAFPSMIDEINNKIVISIDALSDASVSLSNTLPPHPPAPPCRVIGGGKKVQEEQNIRNLEYQDKLEKYKYEMERYKELNKNCEDL